MPLELEEKRAGVRFKLRVSIGSEDELIEEFRIEKSRVQLARLGAISGLPSSAGNPSSGAQSRFDHPRCFLR